MSQQIVVMKMDETMDLVWKEFEALKIKEKEIKNGLGEANIAREFSCDCEETVYTEISEINGTLLCTLCGIVFESRVISDDKEWNDYNNDDGTNGGANMNRCGVVADPLIPSYYSYTEMSGNSKLSLLNK